MFISAGKLITAFILGCCIIFTGCSSQPDLSWNDEEGYRWAELKPGFFGSTGFKKLSSTRTNINFSNDVSPELIAQNRHFLNGSGVAAADINGNGLVDIYFARLNGPNKLYRNLGNYRFEDITDAAGVAHEGFQSTGVVFADVNGNGYPDLLISSLNKQNSLYINDGQGNFTLSEISGLGESKGGKSMTLADINGNGYLDLYITNYKPKSVKDLFSPEQLSIANTVETIGDELKLIPPFDDFYTMIESDGQQIRSEIGELDELYLNTGEGTFEKVDPSRHFFDHNGNEMGLFRDWGLTAKFVDVTGNRLPDIYVANDFWTPDRFWINQGDGRFHAIQPEALRNLSFSSMGVDFSDINRNGYIDFVVTEMLSQNHTRRMRQTSQNLESEEDRILYNRNSVYLNRGDSTFAQIAHFSGLHASEWSWATSFLDVNLNGFEDLIVATGYSYDFLDMDTQFYLNQQQSMGMLQEGSDILSYPPLRVTNKIFTNNGNLTFTDKSREWGFDVEDISHGMALADLNNNGAPDLIFNRFNDTAAIYENRSNSPRIAVRLKGKAPNTQGIGAKIELEGGPVFQHKEMVSGGNYLSGSQAQVVFAAEKRNTDHQLTVTWPDGKISRISGVRHNRIYEIDEAAAMVSNEVTSDSVDVAVPLFEDISDRINHKHHENEFDDVRFQPLLPQKLSRLGPGIAWIDITRNGLDDLVITSAKGGHASVYENLGEGEFRRLNMDLITGEAEGDQTALISWSEGEHLNIVVGNSNYEQGTVNAPAAYLYSINPDGDIEKVNIPGILSATGPLAAADVTGNGFLDVFIGGRFNPGQYPVNAASRLFLNDDGTYRLDAGNLQMFSELGLVTGSLFADFNLNGQPDLLISTEWGALRLFENRNGIFYETTAEAGLGNYKGWWKGIATGDFNNNGLPDIVAVNIGLNSPYQLHGGYPLKMYYDDINWDGRVNIVETYYDDEVGGYVPRRRLHDFGSIPTILNQVNTHREYAKMSVDEIFDVDFSEVPYKEINTLEHMVFLNTGDGFKGQPLPVEAQFTAALSIGVADFDNDGNEDLFLSQNYFSFPGYIPRLDAGRGLILKGDGEGNFKPISGKESGIRICGEQRGAALSDINLNGRVDLAVTQNNGETKLYLNRTEQQGFRIILRGPDSNRDAVGSSIRMVYKDGSIGPRREILAGTGYWSQNSKTQVMGWHGEPEQIEVTWFDGKSDRVAIREGEMSYIIYY